MGCGASKNHQGDVVEKDDEPDKKKRKKETTVLEGIEETALANADAFTATTAVVGAATIVAGAVNVRTGISRFYFFLPNLSSPRTAEPAPSSPIPRAPAVKPLIG